jgi:putative transposase
MCPKAATDQGAQFTDSAFTGSSRSKTSPSAGMAWRDKVFVERLWRTIKYEEVYLRAYESVRDARTSIGRMGALTA